MRTQAWKRTLHRSLVTAAGVAVLAGGSAAWAAVLPPVRAQGAVKYLSGGIGIDESRAISREAGRWPMTLEFAARDKARHEYVADVKVRVRDARGHTVLDTMSDGPFLLARLGPGRYRVNATYEGRTLTHRIDVKAGMPVRQVFVWSKRHADGKA